jgi:biofilm protein TabA
MIVDTLANAHKYVSLHPLFAQAFAYIAETDLLGIELGKYDIADGLKAIFSNKKGMTAEESIAKFECHDKFIDIQLCVKGNETIAWKPREKCVVPKGDYNTEKDVRFFSDAPDTYFGLTDGQFAIFYPEDVHAPMIADDEVRKLVIKVKI